MIEYTNAIGDGVAFSDYHSRHSAVARRQRWFGAVCAVVIVMIVLMSDGASTWELVVWAALVLVAYWPITRWHVRSNVRRLHGEGTNKGTFGWHRLTLTDAGLLEENDSGQSTTRYDALERVVETPEHVFVFVNALSAHVVPKAGVGVGEIGSFVRDLRGRLESKANKPLQPPRGGQAGLA